MATINERVTPHSLRRTYASLRAALRDDPVYIAEQGGRTDPTFVFRVYQKDDVSDSTAPTSKPSIRPAIGH